MYESSQESPARVQKHSFKLAALRPGWRDAAWLAAGAIAMGLVVAVALYVKDSQTPVAYSKDGVTAPWLPSTVTRWKSPIEEMAKKYNLDANLLAILMTIESGGYTKADSGQANGLMQIAPATAKDIAAKYLKTPRTTYDITDPRTNIEFGAAYVAYLRTEFCDSRYAPTDWNGCVELIAAGYNGGPGAANSVYTGKGLGDTQTVVYSRDAFNMWRERGAAKSPTYERWLERGGQTLVDKAKTTTTN